MTAAASTTLPVGAVAPDFALPSTAGTDVTLSSFRGRKHVLLAFFPLAFTSTCTAENCAFSEDHDAFERAGTRIHRLQGWITRSAPLVRAIGRG